MDKKLELELVNKYPDILEDYGQKHTGLFGIWCDDGWYELVDKFCEQVYWLAESFSVKIKVVQIKEKFGALRIYSKVEADKPERIIKAVKEIIDACAMRVETFSKGSCEITGKPGTLCKILSTGRYKTLSYEATRENQKYRYFEPVSNSMAEYWNELDRQTSVAKEVINNNKSLLNKLKDE
jgi:hypothetical protein